MNSPKRLATIPLLLALPLTACALAGPLDENSTETSQSVIQCGQWDTVDVNGKEYVIMNNVWGSSAAQCIDANSNSTRFEVTTSDHYQGTLAGAPAAYPGIFRGCHWNDCTNNSGMPIRARDINTAPSSWSVSLPNSGAYNVAYDIWFHSSANVSGQPDHAELMIWINKRDSV